MNPPYLKGTLWCGVCYETHGTFRRMIARRTISRAGDEYFYFFCVGNNDGTCHSKYINMLEAEQAVEERYRRLNVSPEFIDFMATTLDETLEDQHAAQKALRDQLASQLAALDTRETNLIDLASDGSLPQEKIRARLREISKERDRITAQLERVQDDLDEAAAFIKTALELLRNPYKLYRTASDEVRRRLNQAFFAHLLIHHEEGIEPGFNEPFGDLLSTHDKFLSAGAHMPARRASRRSAKTRPQTKEGAAHPSGSFFTATLEFSSQSAHRVVFCNKTQLVGLTGFEPATP